MQQTQFAFLFTACLFVVVLRALGTRHAPSEKCQQRCLVKAEVAGLIPDRLSKISQCIAIVMVPQVDKIAESPKKAVCSLCVNRSPLTSRKFVLIGEFEVLVD